MRYPKRTVHLDFHTGPAVPDVGVDFDADDFARTFRDAHVDSVTVFATCHHGHAYWLTDRPERHPSLPDGLDLLGDQVRALRGAGIRAPIYLSVQLNEYCANLHPEWIAVDPTGRFVHGPSGPYFAPAWQIMDMSSPYQDHVAGQLEEVLDLFSPVDGIFLDICSNQVSVSKWAIAGMKARGLDPTVDADRQKYSVHVAHGYMDRFSTMVRKASGNRESWGVFFNSRQVVDLAAEKHFVDHVEVEALPTGGWGYSYFPYVARFVRPLGLPGLSHTGRFFKSWGDNTSLKPRAALKYECCQVLAFGLAAGTGDLLHPRGRLHPEVYKLIGDVYRYIEQCEPFVEGARPQSEATLIVDPSLGDKPGPSGTGAVRALQQLRVQFDVRVPAADLGDYRLVIVPESTTVDVAFAEKLRDYVHSGGALIFSGRAGFTPELKPLLPEQGVESAQTSPYSHTFMRADASVSEGLADYPYVMYEPSIRLLPAKGAESLVQMGEPYFERTYQHFSGHDYTPFKELTEFSSAIRNGRVVTFGAPLLEAFGKHGAPNYKVLLGNVIDLLIPERLVRDYGPSHMEVVVARTETALIAHVFSFIPERRAEDMDIIEDPVPLVGTRIALKMESPPAAVNLQPHGRELDHEYRDGFLHVTLDLPDGHGIIVATVT